MFFVVRAMIVIAIVAWLSPARQEGSPPTGPDLDPATLGLSWRSTAAIWSSLPGVVRDRLLAASAARWPRLEPCPAEDPAARLAPGSKVPRHDGRAAPPGRIDPAP